MVRACVYVCVCRIEIAVFEKRRLLSRVSKVVPLLDSGAPEYTCPMLFSAPLMTARTELSLYTQFF